MYLTDCVPIGGRTQVLEATKDFAEVIGVREPARVSNLFEGRLGFYEHSRCLMDPDFGGKPRRRHSGVLSKIVTIVAAGHSLLRSQLIDRDRRG